MPRTKRPEWLRKLATLISSGDRKCPAYGPAMKWAAQFKTFGAAWRAVERWDWIAGILCATLDRDCERYECADTAKARAFQRVPDAARCAAFRKAWPGVPGVVERVLKKVRL